MTKQQAAEAYQQQQGTNYPVDSEYKTMIESQLRAAFIAGYEHKEKEAGMSEYQEIKFRNFLLWLGEQKEFNWTGETWDENTGHDDFQEILMADMYDYWLENIHHPVVPSQPSPPDTGLLETEQQTINGAIRAYLVLPSHRQVEIWHKLGYPSNYDNSSQINNKEFMKWVTRNDKINDFISLFTTTNGHDTPNNIDC